MSAPKKAVRARVMVQSPNDLLLYEPSPTWPKGKWKQFSVLPRGKALYEQMVEQAELAVVQHFIDSGKLDITTAVKLTLRSLNLIPKARQ